MDKRVRRTGAFDRSWLHEPATGFRAITGMDVDMLTPEAFRTVIGKTIADDMRAAMFAHKILHTFYKSHWIYDVPVVSRVMPLVSVQRSVNENGPESVKTVANGLVP